MKSSGLNERELVDAYVKEVRSILELAVPVWHPGITEEQETKIERVQKSALSAILGNMYVSYESALKKTKLKPLRERRQNICLKFINKYMKSKDPILKTVVKKVNTRCEL